MSAPQDIQQRLVRALQRPEAYPHPVDRVECIETHISWVLLAGEYAYKLKKPLDLGFLDFSTLERRRYFCEEELRLNRRLAPTLYQAVVAFSGDPDAPSFDGPGTPFEYAVRMRRFDHHRQLDVLLARDALPVAWMDELAVQVADFHRQIPRTGTDSALGTPQAVFTPMMENFIWLRDTVTDSDRLAQLDRLEHWTRARYQALRPLLAQRHDQGHVRECHGDMHLGNMAHVDGRVLIFDGIEFSETLRWIDVMSEMAFVTMDLLDRGAPAHAHRFLNAWLEGSGDYEGLPLLRFYQVYRAMVRAKISGIRQGQSGLSESGRREAQAACRGYLDLAERLTRESFPALFINHGFSGAGKTTLSQVLVEQLGMVRIRSDVERKRLAGMDSRARDRSGVGSGIYSQDMGERTYTRLSAIAAEVLEAGFPVIVDATFLERARRDRFSALARERGVPFFILDYQAPPDVLRARVLARQTEDTDASDAGLQVLEHQLGTAEGIAADEPVVVIDTQQPMPVERIGRLLSG